jgi:hypothetical protein
VENPTIKAPDRKPTGVWTGGMHSVGIFAKVPR